MTTNTPPLTKLPYRRALLMAGGGVTLWLLFGDLSGVVRYRQAT
ncbi:hypothetical protein [Moraxella bovis]|nr:hypothetical protein [Moraxella bovis]WAJ72510.1 hypothetical protein LP095_06855 [Moraxella bovis]